MPELNSREKTMALSILRQVSMGNNTSVLMDTVFKLLVVAVTQLESRVIELEIHNA